MSEGNVVHNWPRCPICGDPMVMCYVPTSSGHQMKCIKVIDGVVMDKHSTPPALKVCVSDMSGIAGKPGK